MQVGAMIDETSVLLNKLMDVSMRRQAVIANNMANADTPGFVRREYSFQDKMAELVKSGDFQGVGEFRGEVVKDTTTPGRVDGNNVQLTSEMSDMAENGVMQQLLAKSFSTRLNILRSAMKGGD